MKIIEVKTRPINNILPQKNQTTFSNRYSKRAKITIENERVIS
jgi:hypothetical protein